MVAPTVTQNLGILAEKWAEQAFELMAVKMNPSVSTNSQIHRW
jgi:hypothetical protein